MTASDSILRQITDAFDEFIVGKPCRNIPKNLLKKIKIYDELLRDYPTKRLYLLKKIFGKEWKSLRFIQKLSTTKFPEPNIKSYSTELNMYSIGKEYGQPNQADTE